MILALLLDLSGTIITLQPTEYPGAIAEIVMENILVNGSHHEMNYQMTMGDMEVWVSFDWDRDNGSDAILVSPPDGVLCIPADCVLTVPEDATGVLYLYEFEGM